MLKILLLMTLSGSLLGLGLMALRSGFGKRLGSGFFYWAWLIVLLRFALPVGLIPTEKQTEADYVPKPELEYRETIFTEQVSDIEMPVFEVPEAVQPVEKPVYNEPEQSFDFRDLLSMERFWLDLWLAGAAFSVMWHSTGYVLFCRRLRKSLKPVNDLELHQYMSIKQRFKPELAKSSLVSTPMLMGIKNPLLVLPDREYSWDTLNNILLHEFTHYKRGDIVLKWAAMIIFSFHWFNPLTYLFTKEIDRVCELSCDEKLLKTMDARQKQRYGETLLELAEFRTRKNTTLSTCLAMEKHILRERLEQIMKFKKKSGLGVLITVLCLLVLAGCAIAAGPDTSPAASSEPVVEAVESPVVTPMAEPVEDEDVIVVNTVDELLDAIKPGANIVLSEGTFNLSQAKNYGINTLDYSWGKLADGYELQLLSVDNLSITGAGIGKSSIVTDPRSVDVLYFEGGENVSLSGFTVGHTEQAGSCQGDVVSLNATRNVHIDSCDIFGCGYMGIVTNDCKNVLVTNSVIRDCSGMALYSQSSFYVQVENCEIYNCADNGFLFGVHDNSDFVLSNSLIHDNNSSDMFSGGRNKDMKLLGNKFYDNKATSFFFLANDVLVEGCSFEDRISNWYSDYVIVSAPGSISGSVPRAYDSQGNVLEGEVLAEMKHRPIDFSFEQEAQEEYRTELLEVSVKTVDELLAAIAPNTRIILDGEYFDLSTASDYGLAGGDWYYWEKCYDGFELLLTNLENFSIVGRGKDISTIATSPRYANVLNFLNCKGVGLSGFTVGHTEEPGMCSGGVLKLVSSDDILIQDCGIFGCGTIGIDAGNCRNINVLDTEIYDCSTAGFVMVGCRNVVFENCQLRDLPNYGAVLGAENSVNFNGIVLDKDIYYLEDGKLVTEETGEFGIWFGMVEIESDCSMRVDDEPIRFFAGRNTVDVTEEAVTWTVSNPEAVKLDYEDLGYFCSVDVVEAVPGGVLLTASRGAESKTIRVYCLP